MFVGPNHQRGAVGGSSDRVYKPRERSRCGHQPVRGSQPHALLGAVHLRIRAAQRLPDAQGTVSYPGANIFWIAIQKIVPVYMAHFIAK